MEYYEKMEEEIHEFKKYMKMTMDLLCDSYKWKKLSHHVDNTNTKAKYNNISETLLDMFMKEYESIMNKFREE